MPLVSQNKKKYLIRKQIEGIAVSRKKAFHDAWVRIPASQVPLCCSSTMRDVANQRKRRKITNHIKLNKILRNVALLL